MYFSWDFDNGLLTSLELRLKISLSETPTCHLLDSQSNLVLPLPLPGLLVPYWSPVGILLLVYTSQSRSHLLVHQAQAHDLCVCTIMLFGKNTYCFSDSIKITSTALPEGLNPRIQELLVVGLRRGSSLRTKVPFHLIH